MIWKDLGQNIFLVLRLYCDNLWEISAQISNYGAEEKTKIMAIPNRYKDTFDDSINSLHIKSPNILRLVNKESCNIMLDFKNLLIELKLDKNILDGSQ